MKAQWMVMLMVLAGALVGSSAAQAHPPRGMFGDYNTRYYYGRPPVSYYQFADRGGMRPDWINRTQAQYYSYGVPARLRPITPARRGYIP
jgi:hypothetical protein